MSEFDPRAETPLVDWSDLGVSELLPTGTVTLLLGRRRGLHAAVGDPARRDDRRHRPAESDAVGAIAAHDGVRPVEQGEGDSFVVAFARASDAVALCAGVAARAAGADPATHRRAHRRNPAARRRQLHRPDDQPHCAPARPGPRRPTVLSGATEELVVDRLPDGVWLTDLGTHPLRDLPRPERVMQLCHPDLVNDFPPLRSPKAVAPNVFRRSSPVSWAAKQTRRATAAAGREPAGDLDRRRRVGKTRLAIQLATASASSAMGFGMSIWRRSPTPTWCRSRPRVHSGCPINRAAPRWRPCCGFSRDRQLLLVLDNCEHLLDASAELVVALLGAARV